MFIIFIKKVWLLSNYIKSSKKVLKYGTIVEKSLKTEIIRELRGLSYLHYKISSRESTFIL